jgi:MFS family permease
MLLGTAFAGGGAFLLLLSAAPPALSAGVALGSMGTVLVYIAVSPFLARHSTPRERTHLFGVVAAAYVVSTAAGSLLGGVLPSLIEATWPGLSRTQVYRLALFGGALLSALGIPLLVLVRETSGRVLGQGADARERAVRLDRVLALVRDPVWRRDVARVVAQFVIADGLIRLGANLVVPFFNVFFVRHLGASEAWYGALRFAERAIEVVAMLLVAPLALRFGPVATITATQLLSVPMLLVLGFAPTVAIASTAFLFRGTLMEMTVPVRDSFMMDVVPAGYRATANAALLLVGYVLAFVSTRAGGALLESGRYDLAFSLTAAFYTASALLYWRFFRAVPQAAPGRRLELAQLAA